jgi:hypothetical protein
VTRKKVILSTAGVLLLMIAVAPLLFSGDRHEPRYQGVPLSTHILNHYLPSNPRTARKIADSHDAVATLGTNTLPLLSRWLDRKTPPWRVKLGQKLWPCGITTGAFPPDPEVVVACHAVLDLKADGLPLAPQLAKLCADVDAASTLPLGVLTRQLYWWRNEMPLAVEADLRNALDTTIRDLSTRPDARTNAMVIGRVSVLKKLKSMLGQERPSAVIALELKSETVERRGASLRVLSRRGEFYTEAEPLLLAHLASTNSTLAQNAAICLGNFGPQASNSLPYLERTLSHSDQLVRTDASNAISRINALLRDQRAAFH